MPITDIYCPICNKTEFINVKTLDPNFDHRSLHGDRSSIFNYSSDEDTNPSHHYRREKQREMLGAHLHSQAHTHRFSMYERELNRSDTRIKNWLQQSRQHDFERIQILNSLESKSKPKHHQSSTNHSSEGLTILKSVKPIKIKQSESFRLSSKEIAKRDNHSRDLKSRSLSFISHTSTEKALPEKSHSPLPEIKERVNSSRKKSTPFPSPCSPHKLQKQNKNYTEKFDFKSQSMESLLNSQKMTDNRKQAESLNKSPSFIDEVFDANRKSPLRLPATRVSQSQLSKDGRHEMRQRKDASKSPKRIATPVSSHDHKRENNDRTGKSDFVGPRSISPTESVIIRKRKEVAIAAKRSTSPNLLKEKIEEKKVTPKRRRKSRVRSPSLSPISPAQEVKPKSRHKTENKPEVKKVEIVKIEEKKVLRKKRRKSTKRDSSSSSDSSKERLPKINQNKKPPKLVLGRIEDDSVNKRRHEMNYASEKVQEKITNKNKPIEPEPVKKPLELPKLAKSSEGNLAEKEKNKAKVEPRVTKSVDAKRETDVVTVNKKSLNKSFGHNPISTSTTITTVTTVAAKAPIKRKPKVLQTPNKSEQSIQTDELLFLPPLNNLNDSQRYESDTSIRIASQLMKSPTITANAMSKPEDVLNRSSKLSNKSVSPIQILTSTTEKLVQTDNEAADAATATDTALTDDEPNDAKSERSGSTIRDKTHRHRHKRHHYQPQTTVVKKVHHHYYNYDQMEGGKDLKSSSDAATMTANTHSTGDNDIVISVERDGNTHIIEVNSYNELLKKQNKSKKFNDKVWTQLNGNKLLSSSTEFYKIISEKEEAIFPLETAYVYDDDARSDHSSERPQTSHSSKRPTYTTTNQNEAGKFSENDSDSVVFKLDELPSDESYIEEKKYVNESKLLHDLFVVSPTDNEENDPLSDLHKRPLSTIEENDYDEANPIDEAPKEGTIEANVKNQNLKPNIRPKYMKSKNLKLELQNISENEEDTNDASPLKILNKQVKFKNDVKFTNKNDIKKKPLLPPRDQQISSREKAFLFVEDNFSNRYITAQKFPIRNQKLDELIIDDLRSEINEDGASTVRVTSGKSIGSKSDALSEASTRFNVKLRNKQLNENRNLFEINNENLKSELNRRPLGATSKRDNFIKQEDKKKPPVLNEEEIKQVRQTIESMSQIPPAAPQQPNNFVVFPSSAPTVVPQLMQSVHSSQPTYQMQYTTDQALFYYQPHTIEYVPVDTLQSQYYLAQPFITQPYLAQDAHVNYAPIAIRNSQMPLQEQQPQISSQNIDGKKDRAPPSPQKFEQKKKLTTIRQNAISPVLIVTNNSNSAVLLKQ